jgi:HAD superfamily hydrolase (TIGR01549 family)
MKESIKAVVFDFDGTLYYQKPVQAYNLFRIVYRVFRNPRVINDVHLIRQYRSLREEYSKLGIPILNVDVDLANLKELNSKELKTIRDNWLIESQSFAIRLFKRSRLLDQITKLQEVGILIIIWSDYPIEEKSKEINLRPDFSVCSEAPDIQLAKPNPAGLLYILQKLNLKNSQVIMVGDREDRDGESARAANVRYVQVGKEANKALRTLIAQNENKLW